MMKCLAIIPARGGSKRIPRKNIKDFFGKPIMAYSIEAALNSGLFDEVMVSTDDHEIAEIAMSLGAKVPFYRSQINANDSATTKDVIDEVISTYAKNGNYFDSVCCIYSTAPLATKDHLIKGLDLLKKGKLKTVMPVVKSAPIGRSLRLTADQRAEMIWPEHLNARSQDLESNYFDAGQWYWLSQEGLADTIYNDRTGAIVLSELEVQDIDTPIDWKMAELKYQLQLKANINEQF